MLEIELKFRCPDSDAVERQLKAMGISLATQTQEIDHYFRPPDRDFAVTGEAFRLRRVGETNAFTYKGPKRKDTTVKVRTEVELPIQGGGQGADRAIALVTGLGYEPVAVVKKSRKSFHTIKDRFEVTMTLDDCGGVGRFAEIEILAEEADRERAEAVVRSFAAQLGLTDIEPRSYLRMTLDAKEGN